MNWFLNLYRSWDQTNKFFFWFALLALVIGTLFSLIQIFFTRPSIEKYYTEKLVPQGSSPSCKNEPWVVRTKGGNKAVYLSDCDQACRPVDSSEEWGQVTLAFSVSPMAKKIGAEEFVLATLSDFFTIFIKGHELGVRIAGDNKKIMSLRFWGQKNGNCMSGMRSLQELISKKSRSNCTWIKN